MTFEEIFQPGMRHWKEYKDWQADKVAEAPAPGSGPGDARVDLDRATITLYGTASDADVTGDGAELNP